jgi:uncharacterized protein (DUF1800 family)
MQRPTHCLAFFVLFSASILMPGVARAAPPGEVAGLAIDPVSNLSWSPLAGADDYNVYRGLTSWLVKGEGAQCHGDEIAATSFASPANPPVGAAYYYLVTGESNVDGEGTAGTGSSGQPRALRGLCDPVMRGHILDRTGYGWSEWSRDRIAALGIQGYIDEQLDPASIDEASNTDLTSRTALLVPPDTVQELGGLDVVNAVYARRQLEQQATMFWDNHFNTDYRESSGFFGFYAACPDTQNLQAAKLHYDLQNQLRNLAFNGSFREILEAMALSPAMMIYLNTNTNVKAQPNENFARELLELHSMGVDGGYTQQDIVELARVFTGWNVCKKPDASASDPLAACLVISAATYCTPSEPAGQWVRNFRTSQHDTGQKVIFAGTPYQVTIPSTAGNPANGINDVEIALDAILAYPSTPRFIATLLLQRFVDEKPSQAMIDAVVAEWNDLSNPHGRGDLREVLRSVLAQARLRDPDSVGNKIKTPFEQVASAMRAVRGKTDGPTIYRGYLQRMQEQFHQNSVPTGYPELGGDWIDTNNMLDRQNFGYDLSTRTAAAFGADVIGLLNANGVSTAPVPNNAAAIVDFFAGVLFGGALTGAERQAAITYLNTDDNGVVSNYTDARIRETVGFMLGYAQFLEQ